MTDLDTWWSLMSAAWTTFWVAVFIGWWTFAYFVPAVVAKARGVVNIGQVVLVNVLLGWTVVGWFVAFGMALGRTRADDAHVGYWPRSTY